MSQRETRAHHRSTRHRSNVPRRLGLLVGAVLLFGLMPPAPVEAQADVDATLVELVNEWRVSKDLDRLITWPSLTQRSQRWSDHMAAGSAQCVNNSAGTNYGHSNLADRPEPDPVGTVQAAENIARICGPPGVLLAKSWSGAAGPLPDYCQPMMDYSSPENLMCNWLASEGHRAAIENPAYTHFGSATASLDHAVNGWTERFATHSFTASAVLRFDPNCDGVLNMIDAFAVAQYSVEVRTGTSSCALGDPKREINIARSDFNGDGAINILDAYGAANCVVGVTDCNA